MFPTSGASLAESARSALQSKHFQLVYLYASPAAAILSSGMPYNRAARERRLQPSDAVPDKASSDTHATTHTPWALPARSRHSRAQEGGLTLDLEHVTTKLFTSPKTNSRSVPSNITGHNHKFTCNECPATATMHVDAGDGRADTGRPGTTPRVETKNR